jgi:hypothetical protein
VGAQTNLVVSPTICVHQIRMAISPNFSSAVDRVIDLRAWAPDEDFEYHPIGSKPKRNYICPAEPGHPLLIPGHTYLLKVAQGWQGGQMWSEALAFQIGSAVGLDVPTCFVAHDPRTGETGALIEFFVGYAGRGSLERLIHGADLLQGRGFTVGADRPHNLFTNIDVCAELGLARRWWADVVAFDTLIGNTDRHTENWGVLVNDKNQHRMSPIFDNGTSLGYQQNDTKLGGLTGCKLDEFIRKGTHHMAWDLANESRTSHMELCFRASARLPEVVAAIESMIHSCANHVDAALNACTRLKVDPVFTHERAEFVRRLLHRRRELMSEVVKGLR